MIEPFFAFSTSWGGGGYVSPTTFGYISAQCIDHQEIFYPLGSFFAIKREVFQAIGGFTPEYEYLFEEVSLAWKMHRCTNGKAICIPVQGIKHIGLRKGSPQASILQWRNRVLLVVENHEGRDMLLILVLLLFKIIFREPRYALNILFDIISHFYELIKIKRRLRCKYDNFQIYQRFSKVIDVELIKARRVSLLAYAFTVLIYRISRLRKLLSTTMTEYRGV